MIILQSHKTSFYKMEPIASVLPPSPARLFPDGVGAQATGERPCLTGHAGEKLASWQTSTYFVCGVRLPPQSQLAQAGAPRELPGTREHLRT